MVQAFEIRIDKIYGPPSIISNPSLIIDSTSVSLEGHNKMINSKEIQKEGKQRKLSREWSLSDLVKK